eukprot:TRINITY_DN18906_c0_g1_i2.p1 TRINITY_DN18906_c0_g1~~TRINITY_DN18906_c0_g1_i2.p1  ORF type:complete len:174 (-),score=21.65 TRINITY_DN18906_c0_g1_i2:166-657(-)
MSNIDCNFDFPFFCVDYSYPTCLPESKEGPENGSASTLSSKKCFSETLNSSSLNDLQCNKAQPEAHSILNSSDEVSEISQEQNYSNIDTMLDLALGSSKKYQPGKSMISTPKAVRFRKSQAQIEFLQTAIGAKKKLTKRESKVLATKIGLKRVQVYKLSLIHI